MSKTSPAPECFLPLTTAFFYVLLALADAERHGYAIMEHVTQTTDGQVKMGPGTLYGSIKRLLQSKLIEESDERPDPELDDERRRYYRLTDLGLRVMKAEARRYERIVKAARATGLLGKPQSA
jgi:DNA-binding PadR family transcriptional regulator